MKMLFKNTCKGDNFILFAYFNNKVYILLHTVNYYHKRGLIKNE